MSGNRRPRVTLDPADRDRAMALLEREIAATSVAAVARRLGTYGRVTVSMVAAGTYAGRPDAPLARVLEVFDADTVDCPHLDRPLSRPECRTHAGRAMPTGSPAAFRHWEACQSCPHRGDAS
nr:hypothetical protein [uncultured Azospirillum sp.]